MTAFDIRVTLVCLETGKPLATATREGVASMYLPKVGETVEPSGLLPRDLVAPADGRSLLQEPLVVSGISHFVKRLGGGGQCPTVAVRTLVEEGAASFMVSRLVRDGWVCTRDAVTLTRLDTWTSAERLALVNG